MPPLYVGADEARIREAVRFLPAPNCQVCAGSGRTRDGEICQCVEKVTFHWRDAACYGSCVSGVSAGGHGYCARLFCDALSGVGRSVLTDALPAALLTLSLLLTLTGGLLLVGPPLLQKTTLATYPAAGWGLLIAAALVALLAWSVKKRRAFGWTALATLLCIVTIGMFLATYRSLTQFLDSGAIPSRLEMSVASLMALIFSGAFLAAWLKAGVRSQFGLGVPPAASQAWLLLTWKEKWKVALAMSKCRKAVGLFICILLVTFVFRMSVNTILAREIRASLLWQASRYSQAAALYESVANRAKVGGETEKNVRRARQLRLTGSQACLRQGDPAAALDLLRPLATQMSLLGDATIRDSLLERLVSCCNAFIDTAASSGETEHWQRLGEALSILVRSFPDAPQSRTLADRSRWYALEASDVHTVAQLLAFRREGQPDEYLKLGNDRKLVVVRLMLVHIGRTEKELTRTSFSWAHPPSGHIAFVGFPTEDGLASVKSFPEIRLGPEFLAVETAWDAPSSIRQFRIAVGNRGIDVSIGQ